MTLTELLIMYGITRPQDFATRGQIARQYAYALWTGKRRMGAVTARKISAATGIPIGDLITAEPPMPPKRSS